MPAPTSPVSGREASLSAVRPSSALKPFARLYSRRREQILYLVVGGWNTAFGYGVWAMLQFLLGSQLHYLLIVLLSWPLAVLNAYLGYRIVVFHSTGPILRELPRFSLVYLGSLVANLVLLPIAIATLPINIYLIQALFTAAVVVASYLGHRYFSFRRSPRPDGSHSASDDLISGPAHD